MKRWLAAAGLACLTTVAVAQDSLFSSIIGTASLCLDHLEPGYFYNYLAGTGKPYKREQEAYWFKRTATLFGAPVTEVFVSDNSGRHLFVGVISSLPPDQLVEALKSGAPAGVRFWKINPADKYSPWQSSTGAVIVYQGKKAKLFCRGDRMRLTD